MTETMFFNPRTEHVDKPLPDNMQRVNVGKGYHVFAFDAVDALSMSRRESILRVLLVRID